MNITDRLRRTLLWTSWLPLAVAGAVIMYQRETSREVYASTAKLVMDPLAAAFRPALNGPGREERMAEFRAMQVELLKSAQVETGTAERVHLLGQDKPQARATVEILPQGDASTVIELRCLSDDAEYAHQYLQARISAYLVFRKKVIDSNLGETIGQIVATVLEKEKHMLRVKQELGALGQGDPATLREMEEQRLARLVSETRGEIEKLTRAPGAGVADPAFLNAVKARQTSAEQELRNVAEGNAVIREKKAEFDRTLEEFGTWKKRLFDLDEQGIAQPPAVSILQAASPAVRFQPPVLVPMLKGATAGAAIGLVMMLLLIGITNVSRRGTPELSVPS